MEEKEEIKKVHFTAKYKATLAITFIAIVLIGVGIVTYSFFNAPFTNKNMQANLQTGTMSLIFGDGDNGLKAKLAFGESATKKFTLENNGTLEASIGLNWKNLVNTYLNGSLTYTLSYSAESEGKYTEIVSKTNVPSTKEMLNQPIATELSVPAGEIYYYNLEITLNNTDEDQTADINASLNTEFSIGDPDKYINYTLTVDPNGGTWNEFTAPQEYQLMNNDTKDISEPTRVGYTFGGWSVSGVGSNVENSTFTMGIEDTTITAIWTPIKYTVTIDTGNGPEEREVDFGSTITLPETPTKEGYTFTGYEVTGGTLEGNELTITNPNSVTVNATWSVNSYKYIVYHNKMNTDGTTYTLVDADTDEGEAQYNTSVTPNVKTYTGFASPQQKSLTIKAETTYPPVLNKVEYNYARNKYNLTVNLDGGTSITAVSGEMYYEATKDLETAEKTGYNFTNWTTTSGTVEGNIFKIGNSDATVSANYTPKTYSVTFNANGGTVSTQSKTVTYDSTYGDLPTPEYDGYNFLGWFTESDGGEEVSASTTVALTENQTLFAHWEGVKLIITLDANNGYFESSDITTQKIEVRIGNAYGTLPKPSRTCCNFTGWYTTPSEGTQITSETIATDTFNTTLYAHWSCWCAL